jgi:hypothetical protein
MKTLLKTLKQKFNPLSGGDNGVGQLIDQEFKVD